MERVMVFLDYGFGIQTTPVTAGNRIGGNHQERENRNGHAIKTSTPIKMRAVQGRKQIEENGGTVSAMRGRRRKGRGNAPSSFGSKGVRIEKRETSLNNQILGLGDNSLIVLLNVWIYPSTKRGAGHGLTTSDPWGGT